MPTIAWAVENSATNHCVQVARDVIRTLRGRAHTSWDPPSHHEDGDLKGKHNKKPPSNSMGHVAAVTCVMTRVHKVIVKKKQSKQT